MYDPVKNLEDQWTEILDEQRINEIQIGERETISIKAILIKLAEINTLYEEHALYVCSLEDEGIGEPVPKPSLFPAEVLIEEIEHALLCLCFGYRKVLEH